MRRLCDGLVVAVFVGLAAKLAGPLAGREVGKVTRVSVRGRTVGPPGFFRRNSASTARNTNAG